MRREHARPVPPGEGSAGAHHSGNIQAPLPESRPAAVLGVLATVAVAAFIGTRSLVAASERRLLDERADEAGGAADQRRPVRWRGPLAVLAGVGASTEPGSAGVVRRQCHTAAAGHDQRHRPGQRARPTASWPPPRSATGRRSAPRSPPEQATVLRRALAERRLVSDLFGRRPGEEAGRWPCRWPRAAAVVYLESSIDPSQLAPVTPDSPFRQLAMSLYASAEPDPARLVFTTEPGASLAGSAERTPLQRRGRPWLLAVSAREPLVGTLADSGPLAVPGRWPADRPPGSPPWPRCWPDVGPTPTSWSTERTGELERRPGRAAGQRGLRRPAAASAAGAGGPALGGGPPPDLRQPQRGAAPRPGPRRGADPGFLADHVHPEEAPAVEAALQRVVDDGVMATVECRFRHGDGSYSWLAVVAVPETAEDGTRDRHLRLRAGRRRPPPGRAGPAGGPGGGRSGQPGQERVPVPHEPRAAHPAQRRARLRPAARAGRAQRGASASPSTRSSRAAATCST